MEINRKIFNKKRIIFIDRDGVINVKLGKGEYVTKWNEFEFINETLTAMIELSRESFSFIIITNQAGIARNKLTLDDLNQIHNEMKNILQKNKINILDIFYCPHHWDDKCICRKPKPGLFYQASSKYNIQLDKTLYIGDALSDCIASYNASCKSIYIGDKIDLENINIKYKPIHVTNNLLNSMKFIQNYYKSSF